MLGGEVRLRRNTASWLVSGLGMIVAALGRRLGGRLGAGVSGFGLAHIFLGFLEMLRGRVRNRL